MISMILIIDLSIFFIKIREGRVDAYARIFATSCKADLVGRVAVSKGSRGQGLGKAMVEQILDLCEQRFPGRTIEIEAQEQVVGLYEKLGFQTVSEPFILASSLT